MPAFSAILGRFLGHATIVRWPARAIAFGSARVRPTAEAVDTAGAVAAQNAPTAPWKSLRDSDRRAQPLSSMKIGEEIASPRGRAGRSQMITQCPYRVVAFQAFLSGRI